MESYSILLNVVYLKRGIHAALSALSYIHGRWSSYFWRGYM